MRRRRKPSMPQLRMEKAVDRLEPLAPRQEVVEI